MPGVRLKCWSGLPGGVELEGRSERREWHVTMFRPLLRPYPGFNVFWLEPDNADARDESRVPPSVSNLPIAASSAARRHIGSFGWRTGIIASTGGSQCRRGAPPFRDSRPLIQMAQILEGHDG